MFVKSISIFVSGLQSIPISIFFLHHIPKNLETQFQELFRQLPDHNWSINAMWKDSRNGGKEHGKPCLLTKSIDWMKNPALTNSWWWGLGWKTNGRKLAENGLHAWWKRVLLTSVGSGWTSSLCVGFETRSFQRKKRETSALPLALQVTRSHKKLILKWLYPFADLHGFSTHII